MMKKLLSLALALVMMCCMIPVSASAANPVIISEHGMSITMSDVVSYEDVTVCYPEIIDYPEEFSGEDSTGKVRIYHLSKDASIIIQNVDTSKLGSEIHAYYIRGVLEPNYILKNGQPAPYPVFEEDVDDQGSIELGGTGFGYDGALAKGEASGKIRLGSPSKLGMLVDLEVTSMQWEAEGDDIGVGDIWHLNVACAYDNGEYSFTDNTVKKPAQPVTPAVTAVGGFTDVKAGDYFADPVMWAVEKNITVGTSATTFSPGATCNKAQILTFLWRANGSPEPTASSPFTDIKTTDYFYKAALWAAEKGMVSGSAFGANTGCTRAMTVEYMWKAAGSPEASNKTSFTDVPANAEYAQAVAWAVEKSITSGTSAATFSPSSTCTRGQIVTFLYRALAQ